MKDWRARNLSIIFTLIFQMVLSSAGLCRAGEIVLGMSASFTGQSRGLGIELYRGASSYFDYINQQGGIDGNTVRLLALDDGYNPNPAVLNTIAFLNDDKVDGLFGYVGTPTTTRVLPLLFCNNHRRKALFFPFTGAELLRAEKYDGSIYNLRASYEREIAEVVERFVALGRKRVAILYQADAYGRSGWDGLRKALALHGLELVGEATYSRGMNYTQSMKVQAELLAAAKPDAVLSVGSYAACAAFVRDFRDIGQDALVCNLSFVGGEMLLKLLVMEGKRTGKDYTENLVYTQVVPGYHGDAPASVLYRKLMDADPEPPQGYGESYKRLRYSFASFEGFLDAVVMVEIIRISLRDGLTLQQAANRLRDFDPGIGRKVSFAKGEAPGLNHVYFSAPKDGELLSLSDEGWKRWAK